MRAKILVVCAHFTLGLALALPLHGDERVIPPSISKIWPAGMPRGATATFTLDGRNLSGAKEVIFDAPGMTGKVAEITDVPEKIAGPRAGVDLGAIVPLAKKQTAKIEVTVAKDVEPGIHWFRVHTPLGTSGLVVLDIGALPEAKAAAKPPADSGAEPELVRLPATLVGTIAAPGDTDSYRFEGKAGEEIVFQVVASQLGSQLRSLLVLRDDSGQVLAKAGEYDTNPDAVLTFKLPGTGNYTLSVTDREKGGGMDHFYRINAGPLPYLKSVFPLGVRAGEPAEVSVSGVNLGGVHKVMVEPPKSVDGWAAIPLAQKRGEARWLNKVRLAVGNEPEALEQEPNNTPAQAQAVTLPVTINGYIYGGANSAGAADEDYFRFHAEKGENLSIEVAAARLNSPLDSVIEVLDAQGKPIPRATIRCLNQTTTTLSDRDSRSVGIRLTSTSGIREGDYLMIGDELDQVAFVPDQPDADTILRGIGGLRVAFLGTSPDARAVNTRVYKVEILPAEAEFPANGLPVFHLTWRNDDGGPGYGADSRLDFVAPNNGDYILRLKDVRGLEGPEFSYRLTIRDANPDYQLRADPGNPNIPRGGSVPVTVSANRARGYEGPVEIEVQGLPQGVTASQATIPQAQDSTVLVLSAGADAPIDAGPAPIKILGHAQGKGHDLVRTANEGTPLQVVSVIPPPDLVVSAQPGKIGIEPGQEVTVTLQVQRQNGFKSRVPCSVRNLPPGVRVVNIGLNGVLVTEDQSSRTFTLRAEDWAKPIIQPIYVVGEVESNSPTLHASAPLILKVAANQEATAATEGHADNSRREGESRRPPNR